MTEQQNLTESLQVLITDEVLKALGLPPKNWSRKILQHIIYRATFHFSELCAAFDADIQTMGLHKALMQFLPNFVTGSYHSGTSRIPETGPLLVTSNHPGAADALTALTLLRRDDIKIVLSGVPFTEALPNAQQHFIHVTADVSMRSMVIREIIAHLTNGGAIFIFPTGHVTPDPSTTTDPEVIFADWSQSVALILHRYPEVFLVMTVISGVIQKRFLNSPLIKLRKLKWRQQILAEFMQIITLMLQKKTPHMTPIVTFMAPISGQDLIEGQYIGKGQEARGIMHAAILNHARAGLALHGRSGNIVDYTSFHK